MEKNTLTKIVCPHCGAEYTIGEIFMPNYLIGVANKPIKDSLGKIIYVDWNIEPENVESYNCDFCHKDFATSVDLKVKNVQTEEELINFKENTVSLF